HDLGVIRYICDRVALIYRGQLVEEGDTEAVFRSPASDYARMLLAAMPDPDPDRSPFHASSHATRPAPGPGQPPAASP
ncbi:ABC transporter ATP-binding protein, partial [Roseomonas sp. DSM 102946]|nr:ABC transporter ATP-binding protein [Roseomonas sp. DSM 102946]